MTETFKEPGKEGQIKWELGQFAAISILCVNMCLVSLTMFDSLHYKHLCLEDVFY